MSKQITSRATQGFTLVELSIVIVIIGFLVAGIAAGANMVKQAEIRSVIGDLQSYQTAYNNFVAKYNKAPGDMDTALSFWPTTCSENNLSAECDGNGNGKIEAGATFSTDEVRKALKHLSLANMISAGIPVIPDPLVALVAGTNAPTSKISGAGYMLVSGVPDVGATLNVAASGFTGSSANVVYIGKSTGTTENLVNGALKPEDAFSIDQKMDDGIVNGTAFSGANTGNVRVMDALDVAAAEDCATDTTTALSFTDYKIATTTTACMLGLALN